MTITPALGPTAPQQVDDPKLRSVVAKLEAVFVDQLFKAMRTTVPQDGIAGGGTGEEMFTSMLDEELSQQVPGQLDSAISDALLRQLRGAIATQTPSTRSHG